MIEADEEGVPYCDRIVDLDTATLIATVQSVPALYDRKDSNYNNRRHVYRIWKKIGEELNVAGDTAKRRWTHLRDYFHRLYREYQKTKKKVKWAHYNAMTFLIPHVTFLVEEASPPSSPHYLEEVNETSPPAPRKRVSGKSISPCPRPPKANRLDGSHVGDRHEVLCKREVDADRDDMFHRMRTVPAHTVQREDPEDEDLLFFKSLIPKMKSFNEIQKMEVQAEIHGVILKHVKLARAAESSSTKAIYIENAETPSGELYCVKMS